VAAEALQLAQEGGDLFAVHWPAVVDRRADDGAAQG
jgi:hypothetical protein